jgi:hypothetical protein
MKQWLNTPVTYGCMIRVLLICGFAFLVFVVAIGSVLNIGGPHWAAISATTLTVVGILIALGQWLIPLKADTDRPESIEASNDTNFKQALALLHEREKNKLNEGTSNQGTGTLIVWATEEKQGVTVYLLQRDEYLCAPNSAEREKNKHKKVETITGEIFGTQLLYIAIFRGLRPERYNAWTAWGKDHPISRVTRVHQGQISWLKLDW